MQSVAWITMFADYLHTKTVAAALTSTFDGRAPCKLCKAVKQGRASEQQIQKSVVKSEAVLLHACELRLPVAGSHKFPRCSQEAELKGLQPAIPPPRPLV